MNQKIYSAIVIAVIAAAIAIWAATKPGATNQSTTDSVFSAKKLTICYTTWPPSVTKDPNTSELSGFLIDAVKTITEDADLKLSYVESSWGGFSADVNSGRCDAGIAGYYPLINRSTAVAFTRPFYYAGNNGVVRAGETRFQKISDLNQPGVKIAVLQGEYADIFAKKFLPKAELVVLEQTADNTAPLVAVSSGQADVGLIVDDVVKEYAKSHPEIKTLFAEPYSVTPIAWATRPTDQELLNFFNNALNYLEATGELDALAQKYNATWYTLKREYQILK